MKKFNFSNLRRTVGLLGLKLKKHSPQIMVVAGCTGTVVGTVWACKQTLKLEGTIDEAKAEIDAVKANTDDKKELAKVYAKGLGKVVKVYAGPVIVEGLSLGMIFGSNNIMRRRNAEAAAAYATLQSMFNRYRKNVVDTYGKDVDHDMRFGVKRETIEEVVTDEKGKSKVVKKEVEVIDQEALRSHSDYARFFDESCQSWDKCSEYNIMFINGVQSMMNNRLIAKGYVFLNEVYSALGMEPSYAGNYVGWLYDKNDPSLQNFIDFGMYEPTERKRSFVNGYENVILLDFNVDGDLINNPRLNGILENMFPGRFALPIRK